MGTILVVEDDPLVLATVSRMLDKAGHTVITAPNGKEGIKKFKAEKIDLILTDIIMPEQEGLATIREIRKLDSDVPVIAMSGGGRKRNMEFLTISKEFGANAQLAKPFSADQLNALISECLAGGADTNKS